MASTVSPTNPNLVIDPKISRRGKYLIPEIAVAPGPIDLDIGTGAYQNLFGYVWAAAITKDGKLSLYQFKDGAWSLVINLTDTPISPDKMRHLSLAFDQSGKPIVAFEHEGLDQIYVRQWDPVNSTFIYRGPFDGVDPVLIMDATVHYQVDQSDILLFYMSIDRYEVRYRIQREQYSSEYPIATVERETFIDQAVPVQDRIVIYGTRYTDGQEFETIIETELYPIYGGDDLATNMSAPPTGLYYPVVLVQNLESDSLIPGMAVPPAGLYQLNTLIVDLGTNSLAASMAVPPTGLYYSVVVVADLGTDSLSPAGMSMPATGLYYLTVVVVDFSKPPYGIESLGPAAMSIPTGGSYVTA